MGCISSKLNAEDVVGRCKARRKLMKQAVEHRHGFAAAHVAYLQALRSTGAALKQFAEGERGLPASGHGPFARTPEPPPPPPPMPPGLKALSDPTSPLAKAVTPALAMESPAANAHGESLAAPKDWDFCEPFDPSEPPLHLQKQRETVDQKTLMDSESHAERGIDSSEADEKQATVIADQDGSQHSAAITEMHIEGSITDKKDGSSYSSPANDIQSAHRQENKDDPTEWASAECLPNLDEDDDLFEHELGLMLRGNAKKDLTTIVRELDEEFLKAASGAASVTRELEACKPRGLDSTVQPKSKLRKYNSARVFSAFKWNWSRNPLFTMEDLNESSKNSSHALTLDRLLAWERKLFEEVKVVESLCTEREKKCLRLRRQEIKGEDAVEIEKTRVEIKRLQSLIMVSYHAVDATIEAIEDLRDDELHPQLVALIDELMSMWVTMHRCHARQTQIIFHIKSLDAMMSQEPTTEAHHQATVQLEKELHGWYESFCKLVATQRRYMAALHGWLKLSLMPIPTGKEKMRMSAKDGEESEDLEIYRVCEEWHRALGCLPDKVASEAIKSLAEVVRAMVGKQAEEMKQKRKADKLEKLWEKKMLALRLWEEEEGVEKRRNKGRRRGDEECDTDTGEEEGWRGSRLMPAVGGLLERREVVAVMKKKVEAEMMKHGRAVQDTRVLTMNHLQTGLPGVLEAMTGFAAVCSQAFQHLHSLTRFPLH